MFYVLLYSKTYTTRELVSSLAVFSTVNQIATHGSNTHKQHYVLENVASSVLGHGR